MRNDGYMHLSRLKLQLSGDRVQSAYTSKTYDVMSIGILNPSQTPTPTLQAGQVGYIILNMKDPSSAHIGDTFHHITKDPPLAFPGFKPVKPMVFAGLFPVDSNEMSKLETAIEKLRL